MMQNNNKSQNPLQNQFQNQSQNPLQNQFQNQSQNPFQNPLQNQFQNQFQNPLQNPLQNQSQNPFQNSLQNQFQNPFQNPFQNQSQNPLQNPFHIHHSIHHSIQPVNQIKNPSISDIIIYPIDELSIKQIEHLQSYLDYLKSKMSYNGQYGNYGNSINDQSYSINDQSYFNPYEHGSRQRINDQHTNSHIVSRDINIESKLLQPEMTKFPGQKEICEKEVNRFEVLPFSPQDVNHLVWGDGTPKNGVPTRNDRIMNDE